MPQEVIKTLSGRSYYDNRVYDNVVLSSVIAIDSYFEKLLFPGDDARIVISRNEFAFRRRLQSQRGNENSDFQLNTLNMPFLNFAPKAGGIVRDTSRIIKSHPLEVSGFYVNELKRKMRLTPLHIDFEGTYFSTEESDVDYVVSRLQWQMTEEILLRPVLEIGGHEFYNYGSLVFSDAEYNSRYEESDFLEKNRIKTVGLVFGLDTYLPNFHDASSDSVVLPKRIVLGFSGRKNLDTWDWTSPDELYTGTIDHSAEKVYMDKS